MNFFLPRTRLKLSLIAGFGILFVTGFCGADEVTMLLENADRVASESDSVGGQFHFERRVDGQVDLILIGRFQIWKDGNSLPQFDIIYENRDGELVKRIWSEGAELFCRVEGGEAVKSSAFRGGTQLKAKYSLGVASHFTKPNSFSELVAYRPTLLPIEAADEVSRVEISSPQKKWQYSFHRDSNQLESLVVEETVDEKVVTETTRYMNLRFELGAGSSRPAYDNVEFKFVDGASRLIGKDLSETPITFSSNEPGKLGDLKGKVVVIDFWASWCGPCLKEIPGLEKLSEQLSKDKVEFMLVPWYDSPKSTQELAKKLGFKIPQCTIGQTDAEIFELEGWGIPTVFVLDQNGCVADVVIGSHGAPGKAHLKSIINGLMRDE